MPKQSAVLGLFLAAALMLAAGGVQIFQVTGGAFIQVSGFGME